MQTKGDKHPGKTATKNFILISAAQNSKNNYACIHGNWAFVKGNREDKNSTPGPGSQTLSQIRTSQILRVGKFELKYKLNYFVMDETEKNPAAT